MKKILVPTDFSENSMKAAIYAAEIAKRSRAKIYFLHAMELGMEKIYQPFSLHEKYNHLVLEDRKTELETFCRDIQKIYTNVKTETILEDGMPVDSIIDFCVHHPVDMIIMGTKGAGGIKERLVGTVAAGVISRSKIPVLVVPGDYVMNKPGSILFATNHFEKDENILTPLVKFATLFSAKITVGLFIDTDNAEPTDFLQGNRNINEYLKFLNSSYPELHFNGEVIRGKDFENSVELYHTVHDSDITAMIRYPKGAWEKIFHRSATRKMVFHSAIPVLIIPFIE